MKHLVEFFTYWCTHNYLQDVVLSVAGVGGGREGKRKKQERRKRKRKILKSTAAGNSGTWVQGLQNIE